MTKIFCALLNPKLSFFAFAFSFFSIIINQDFISPIHFDFNFRFILILDEEAIK
jgi:hypothetical protein